MSCEKNSGLAADASAKSGGIPSIVSRAAYNQAKNKASPTERLWQRSGARLRKALRGWRSAKDDAALMRLRMKLAGRLAEQSLAVQRDDHPAGRARDLAEARAELLLDPPTSLTVGERVERVAILDNAIAMLRHRRAINESEYRTAIVDAPCELKLRPPRSQSPVSWLPQRAVGAEVETSSQANPGRKITTRYRVVDLDEPIASNTPGGAINPDYDQALQPRRRERAASELQINAIARKLEANDLLKGEANWDDGPPIVNQEGMIESGNGRALGLRRAAESNPEGYQAYRQKLADRAFSLGLDRSEVEGMKRPLLVRERLTKMSVKEQAKFVTEANSSGAARMGAAEQARADAKLIEGGFFTDLDVSEWDTSLAGVLSKKVNEPVVSRFLRQLPETEQAALLDKRGKLSADGKQRLERAMFAYALPGQSGERLSNLLYESGEAIDRVGAGLKGALSKLGQAEDRIQVGHLDPKLRLGEDLAVAVEKMRDIRQLGLSVNDYLRQHKMFPELSEFQEQLLAQLDARRRSGKKVAELLNAYADRAQETPSPQQGQLLGGQGIMVTKEGLFRAALKEVDGAWVDVDQWSASQQAISGFGDIPAAEIERLNQSQQQLGRIAANNITQGGKKRGGVAWVDKWQVPTGKGDKTYTVSRDAKGRWGCSCSKWIYQRKPKDAGAGWWREPCEHIQAQKGLVS